MNHNITNLATGITIKYNFLLNEQWYTSWDQLTQLVFESTRLRLGIASTTTLTVQQLYLTLEYTKTTD